MLVEAATPTQTTDRLRQAATYHIKLAPIMQPCNYCMLPWYPTPPASDAALQVVCHLVMSECCNQPRTHQTCMAPGTSARRTVHTSMPTGCTSRGAWTVTCMPYTGHIRPVLGP
jgi:hypothetical protein